MRFEYVSSVEASVMLTSSELRFSVESIVGYLSRSCLKNNCPQLCTEEAAVVRNSLSFSIENVAKDDELSCINIRQSINGAE